MSDTSAASPFPRIRPIGLDGLLVSFSDRLSEPANRAALAFRSSLESDAPDGVEETSTSLASTYVRFDPLSLPHATMIAALKARLEDKDWYDAELPHGRRRFILPTCFHPSRAPQIGEAAAKAGLSTDAAIADLTATTVRVLTLGFAPGQPYLGELSQAWDLPRQTDLTPQVPVGALALAIRQFVLFSVSAPTGWRHVGQTAFRAFRPESVDPFPLRPGDELQFRSVPPEELDKICDKDTAGDGGARIELLP